MRHLFLSASFGVLGACMLALPAAADESTPSASESEVAQAGESTETKDESTTRARKPIERIEEITVTARKREENLQETPISITAFSAEDIKDQEIRRIDDISELVPNLQFDSAVGQSNAARISIRGVGNGDPIITDDPGVGVYVDGVFLPRAQGALLAVSDIERIEVLRGPQGTLFGKNTVGGAVSIVTKKPSYEFGGEAEVRVGNYDLFATKIAMNLPLVPERVATRLSFTTEQRDGYTKNRFVGGGSTTGDDRLLAGRAQVLFNVGDSLELLFSGDQSFEPRGANAPKCKFIGPRPAGSRVESPEAGAVQVVNAAVLAAQPNAPGANTMGSNANAFTRACAEDDQRDNFKISQDGRLEDELKTFGTSLTASWSLSEKLTFKSTSSWRRNKGVSYNDGDGTSLAVAQDGRDDHDRTKQDAISQELNLAGVAFDNKLNWVVGVYGFREKNRDNERGQAVPILNGVPNGAPLLSRGFLSDGGLDPITGLDRSGFQNADITALLPASGRAIFPGGNFISFPDLSGSGDCVPGTGIVSAGFIESRVSATLRDQQPGRLEALKASNDAAVGLNADGLLELTPGALSCSRNFIGLTNLSRLRARTVSYAAYSQASYDVTDAFSITAGLRFTHEQKRIKRFQQFTDSRVDESLVSPEILANSNISNQFELTDRFSVWTPMFNLKYAINDDVNVYATYSRGFKSGGFNGRANGTSFDPEVLTSYEAGLKSRFFDGRVQLNVAAFTNIYRDIQLTVIGNDENNNIIVSVDNAGKAAINGTEIETTVLAPYIDGLVLTTSLGITAARYVEFDRAGFGNVKLPNTPAYTGTISAAYTIPLGGLGDLASRLTWSHTGTKASDVSDPHFTRVNKHGVLGARFSWMMTDGKTEIALFGSNLLNREYFANAIDVPALGTSLRYYAPPITYGLEISRQF